MLIRMLTNHQALTVKDGDGTRETQADKDGVYDVPDDLAAKLIAAGNAEAVDAA